MIRALQLLLALCGSSRRLLASLLLSLGQAALLVPIPIIVRHVFDAQLPSGDAGGVLIDGLLVLALYLASAGLALWGRWTLLIVTKRAVAELRRSLIVKLYALPRSYHDRVDARDLEAIVVQDSERLDVVANVALGQMLPAGVVSVGLAVVALVLDPVLFTILACAVPVMVLVKWRIGGDLRRRTRHWQEAFAAFSGAVQTGLRAHTLAQARGAAGLEVARLGERVDALSDAGLRMAWRQSLLAVSQRTISTVSGVLVLIIGGSAVATHSMAMADLLSFYAIVALLQGQVGTIVSMLPLVISGGESLDRLTALLSAEEPAPYRGSERHAFRGRVQLVGVTFGYGGEPVIRDLDLAVEPGEHIIIVGPNGAGKSTLASLILGLYAPKAGEVRADGIPYSRLDMRGLRAHFGVLLQDPVLLPGTIAENIAYGWPDATETAIHSAAAHAGAAEFIERMSAGYATEVGNEGALLSGGQRQRIALARALLGEPRLLVLDEPTTHLDWRAIVGLRALLSDLPERPTVITITHDESLAGVGDRVVHLREGRLLASELPSMSGQAV